MSIDIFFDEKNERDFGKAVLEIAEIVRIVMKCTYIMESAFSFSQSPIHGIVGQKRHCL